METIITLLVVGGVVAYILLKNNIKQDNEIRENRKIEDVENDLYQFLEFIRRKVFLVEHKFYVEDKKNVYITSYKGHQLIHVSYRSGTLTIEWKIFLPIGHELKFIKLYRDVYELDYDAQRKLAEIVLKDFEREIIEEFPEITAYYDQNDNPYFLFSEETFWNVTHKIQKELAVKLNVNADIINSISDSWSNDSYYVYNFGSLFTPKENYLFYVKIIDLILFVRLFNLKGSSLHISNNLDYIELYLCTDSSTSTKVRFSKYNHNGLKIIVEVRHLDTTRDYLDKKRHGKFEKIYPEFFNEVLFPFDLKQMVANLVEEVETEFRKNKSDYVFGYSEDYDDDDYDYDDEDEEEEDYS